MNSSKLFKTLQGNHLQFELLNRRAHALRGRNAGKQVAKLQRRHLIGKLDSKLEERGVLTAISIAAKKQAVSSSVYLKPVAVSKLK